ncbi:MAG: hypothetical protein E7604_00660 [Ruminococcaceae bacterium]|nr:hypothetical protein [Oscillospiraceae bacterium]
MKTVFRILTVIFAAILFVLAAAFLFLEGRLIVSGDWLLHEMPLFAFMQYFSRFAIAFLAAVGSICLLRKQI